MKARLIIMLLPLSLLLGCSGAADETARDYLVKVERADKNLTVVDHAVIGETPGWEAEKW